MKTYLAVRVAVLAVAVLLLGACGDGRSEVVAQTSVADDARGGDALGDAPPTVPGPELVSGPTSSIPSTTLAPTATVEPVESSSSSSVPADNAPCESGADFPQFDAAEEAIDADMDGDGVLDQVYLLDDMNGLSHRAWVAVIFASGGMATGQYDGYFETSVDYDLRAVDLTSPLDGIPEILFVPSSGPAISQSAVVTLIDCTVVTTTLHGRTFQFDTGETPTYVSYGGCAYGTGGRLEFDVTEVRPTVGEWEVASYTLDGATWTEIGRHSSRDLPGLDSPTFDSLDNCTGHDVLESTAG